MSERKFQLWDYDVSHARLLIRSPRTEGVAYNVDFRFYGVEYLQIGTLFHGLTVEEVREWPDGERPAVDLGVNDRIFLLHTAGRTDIIVAAILEMEKNDLDIFQSSLQTISG